MYLKSLTLQGFKSFCDRTPFEFSGGITAIVGPNGCGKSNLVDALKWIFGEQSPKDLRGQEMRDVIFAGTDTRKPLGFAEVIVVFDNSDGILNSERSEVSITRRLYRSGESDYRMNGGKCRLKDIRELLAGTGIGTESYSILEQGKLDLLLQTTPRERRLIFEEAAGISRFRAKRDESLRRLARTEDLLLRINDLLSEIEKRIRSVRIQAGRAKRYREIEAALRAGRLRLAWYDLVRLYRERAEWTFRRFLAAGKIRETEGKKAELETEVGSRRRRCAEAEREVNTLGARLQNVRSQQISLGDTIQVTEKRIEELGAAHERWVREAEEGKSHLAGYERELEGLESECGEAENAELGLREKRRRGEEELQGAVKELKEREEELSREREALVEILESLTSLRNEHSRAEAAENLAENRLERLRGEGERVRRQFALALWEEGTARNRLSAVLFEKRRNLEVRREVEAAARDEAGRLAEREREWAETRARIQAVTSRRELLERLLADLEGVNESAKKAVRAARSGELPQVKGLLAELIAVDPAYARGIEGVLGPWAQAIVVSTKKDLEAVKAFLGEEAAFAAVAVEEVSEARAVVPAAARGVGTALEGRLGAGEPESEAQEAAPQGASLRVETPPQIPPGPFADYRGGALRRNRGLVLGERRGTLDLERTRTEGGTPRPELPFRYRRAVEVIEVPRELRAIVEAILHRTLVVEEEIWGRLGAADAAGWRVVSARGAIREPWGGLRWGSPSGVLVRRTELNQCAEELTWLETREKRLSEEIGARKVHLERLNDRLSHISRRDTALVGRIHALEETVKQVDNRKADLLLQSDVVEKERRSLTSELEILREKRRALRQALTERERERWALEERVAAGEKRLHEAVEERRRREGAIAELRVKEAAARENLRRLREARERLLGLLEERRRHVEEAEKECARTAELAQRAREELVGLRDDLQTKIREESEVEHALRDARGELEKLIEELRGAEERLGDVERLLEEKRSELGEIQLEERELAVKADNVADGVLEEYGIDLRAVARGEIVSEELEELTSRPAEEGLREKVAELKDKLAKHGNVNLAAIEELRELEDRFGQLAAQRDDLVRARTSFHNAINDLNRKSRKLFAETFRAVNSAFGELFRKAFGGGKAELLLEEGQDILTAGIEIIARPPGKKPASVRLLSGGERTLTTLVLLFALLRVKPTPFVVLDEVDAPLDEANIRRFLVLLDEFTDRTQFLLITHNKLTMVKSNRLIGVTMEEKGVSKKIAINLKRLDEELEAAGIEAVK